MQITNKTNGEEKGNNSNDFSVNKICQGKKNIHQGIIF